jgi:hypothetical protein
VAKASDVAADLRRFADMIPADILARLSRVELRARCEYAAEQYKTADTAQPEHARYLVAHARKALRAMPVLEFISEQRRLKEHRGGAGDYMRQSICFHRIREHKEANVYPPGLVAAVDDALLGKASSPEAVEIVMHGAKAAS